MTKAFNLDMPIDDLWKLYEEVDRVLAEKLTTEKRRVEDRLNQLRGDAARPTLQGGRRAYPTGKPKYQNPNNPAQTWAGRGKTPLWVTRMLAGGKRLEDLLINDGAADLEAGDG
jgi:DNA-binding protein H-NS